MARKKGFERSEALRTAVLVFQRQGFGATTTDDLRHAMGIGRQSFYDTFISKEDIYLEALQVYTSDRFAMFLEHSYKYKSPLEAILNILLIIPNEDEKHRNLSCLGISSVCEFGETNRAVSLINKTSVSSLLTLLAALVTEGQVKGEIKSSLNPSLIANYLLTLISGLRINARSETSPEIMTQIVEVAVSALKIN